MNRVLGAVLPLWIASGSADYVLHRRSQIEATSGVAEAVLHCGGIAACALPVVSGLLLEINAGTLGIMIAGFTVHAATSWCDVTYAGERRTIARAEHAVHALLQLSPLVALISVVASHRVQAAALFGAGSERPSFALRCKERPLPRASIVLLGIAFGALVVVPYAEELARCLRFRRSAGVGERAILDADSPVQHREIR